MVNIEKILRRISFLQSVEKLTGAHTEGEIKVLVELFQTLAGSKSSALRAAPLGQLPKSHSAERETPHLRSISGR